MIDPQPGYYVIVPTGGLSLPKVAYVFKQSGRMMVRAEQLGDRDLNRGLYQGWSWGPRIEFGKEAQS